MKTSYQKLREACDIYIKALEYIALSEIEMYDSDKEAFVDLRFKALQALQKARTVNDD